MSARRTRPGLWNGSPRKRRARQPKHSLCTTTKMAAPLAAGFGEWVPRMATAKRRYLIWPSAASLLTDSARQSVIEIAHADESSLPKNVILSEAGQAKRSPAQSKDPCKSPMATTAAVHSRDFDRPDPISFASHHRGNGTGAWRKMYHYFELKRKEFLQHYHKRSNVESTFSMMKRKFADGVRSKTDVAMTNKVLCKVLCHNLVVLINEVYELGIDPVFWNKPSVN